MRTIFKLVAVLFFVLSVCLGLFSYYESIPYRKADEEKRELKDLVIHLPEKQRDSEMRKIDFKKLQEMNPDIVGWIVIPGTNVDYPVLKGKTEEVYLDRDYKGEYSPLGSIFTFPKARANLLDAHVCLFGHNTRNKRMFGELKQYVKEEFLKAHSEMILYTPKETMHYKVFSVYECNKADFTFEYEMESGSELFQKLKKHLFEQNLFRENENLEEGMLYEQIVTLSCCSDHERTARRMTVHFRRVD